MKLYLKDMTIKEIATKLINGEVIYGNIRLSYIGRKLKWSYHFKIKFIS